MQKTAIENGLMKLRSLKIISAKAGAYPEIYYPAVCLFTNFNCFPIIRPLFFLLPFLNAAYFLFLALFYAA